MIPSFEKEDTLAIYKNRVKTGSYVDEDYEEADLELFDKGEVWTSGDIQLKKDKVILAIGGFHLMELIDLNPGQRGLHALFQ